MGNGKAESDLKKKAKEMVTDGNPTDEKIIRSSGNVFADLGFENPEEERAKADLVSAISRIVDDRGLTQSEVSQLISVDQPTVSKLLRGRTSGFSLERLIAILSSLGQDVEISVRPAHHSKGQVSVAVAKLL